MLFGSKTDSIKKAIAKKKSAALIKLAKDPSAEVRIAALRGLGEIKSNDGFAIMTFSLNDIDASVRGAAAEALAMLGDAHGKAHIVFALNKEIDAAAQEAMREAILKLKNY